MHTPHRLGALVAFAIVPAIALAPALAQAQQPGLDTAAVAQGMRNEMRATRTPGASIAIVIDGRIAYAQGFGVLSIESGTPVAADALFRIGSVTKVFTGMTALLMAREGKLSLATPIGQYARGLSAPLRSLTLQALLSHTAGVIGEAANTGPHDDRALGDRVRSWGREHVFAPANDVYSYTGAGYWLAGYALEQASGAWYADLVSRTVLQPLGMQRSTLRPTTAMTYPLALDHRVRGDSVNVIRPYPDDVSTWPSGSLFSTAPELARLGIALISDGMIDGQRVLPQSVVTSLVTVQSRVPGSTCGYSYGLSLCDGAARRLSHYGFRVGSGAVFTVIPDRRIAVIILANRNGGIFSRTEAAVLKMLGVPDDEPTRASDNTRPKPFTAVERQQFTGRYVNGSDTLNVIARRDSLFYRYGANEQRLARGDENELLVLDASGEPEQAFRFLNGARSGAAYLHEGISAFRRISTKP